MVVNLGVCLVFSVALMDLFHCMELKVNARDCFAEVKIVVVKTIKDKKNRDVDEPMLILDRN